ncbi:integrin alpha-4-like [Cloeon dipterum]|uniref:integrin alpha-4-like n=1 Tax=Cloeon dipterum TaxID=197152 RepID=UPI00322026E0
MWLRLKQLACVVALILFTGVASFNLDLEHTLIYQSENNDDYFGFSIGLHAGNTAQDGKTWLIAGAPKANDTSLPNSTAPGAVFICNFKEQCTKLKVTGTMEEIANKFDSINERSFNEQTEAFKKVQECLVNGDCKDVENAPNDNSNKPRSYSFIYNDSMIGSTIDVSGKYFLICSPRVKVFYKSMPKYHRMYGFCHLGRTNNINKTIKTIVPFFSLRNSGEFVNVLSSNNKVLFKNVWGQAGFSGTLRKRGGGILLGAPGADTFDENTLGKVVAYETSPANNKSVPTTLFNYRVESKQWSDPNTTNLGYSVTTGNYFTQKSLFYVSGAPLTLPAGEVHLFTRNNTGKRILLRGNQYGENFGATLATGDLNGDTFDDLLVGSPQYSSGSAYQNEGKVTVFLGGGSNLNHTETIMGKNRNGRFGQAISCIGDIDRDGNDDFAVSEPFYESGAVHVFMGSKNGLILSQIIYASKIHPQLAGFGYSISRGRDMDKNGFADIAIGSYKSGHVVILRTKPVVNLEVNLTFTNERVPVNETELTVTFCIFGDSAVKLPSINVSYKFTQMDHRLTRKGQGNVVQLPVDGKIHCYNESFNLNNIKVEQLIKLTGNFSILCDKTPNSTYLIKMGNADTINQEDLFDQNCAMSKQPHVVRDATAGFQLECNNGTCQADLKISVSVSSMGKNIPEIVVGSLKSATLTIVVENSGEPAYNALVEIHSQTDLSDSQCSHKGLTYTCRPENLLRMRWQRDIEIILEKNSLDVFVRVLTDSQLKNNTSSQLNFSLPFVYVANVSVFGQQNDSVRYFQPEVKEKQLIYSSFTYEISKQGPSPLEKVQLSVFIPFKTARNGRFVSVLNRAVSSMECLLIDKDEPMNMPEISAYNESRSTERDFKPNETLIITCNNREWNCGILQCTTSLPSKIPQTTSFSVTVDIAIDTSKIAKELGKKEMVMIETTATVKVLEPNVNFRRSSIDNPNFYRLSTVLQRIVVKKISLWIYVGAGAGGLLLVFLIIGGLYKAGFFRRKVKEELKVLKRQTQMLLDHNRTEQLEARIASLLAAQENEEGDEDDDEAKA